MDWRSISRTLKGLGLMNLEDTADVGLTNFKAKMAHSPADVLAGLRKMGRTTDTESFLKSVKPDVDEVGLQTIFGTSTGLNLSDQEKAFLQQRTQNIQPQTKLIDLKGVGFGVNPQPTAESLRGKRLEDLTPDEATDITKAAQAAVTT